MLISACVFEFNLVFLDKRECFTQGAILGTRENFLAGFHFVIGSLPLVGHGRENLMAVVPTSTHLLDAVMGPWLVILLMIAPRFYFDNLCLWIHVERSMRRKYDVLDVRGEPSHLPVFELTAEQTHLYNNIILLF